MSDTKASSAVAAPAVTPAVVAAPTPVLTPDARAIEQRQFDRILARDDLGREKAAALSMVAIASFTLVEDGADGLPVERVVNAGDDFEISAYDFQRYGGRGRLKALDDPNRAGVTSNRP